VPPGLESQGQRGVCLARRGRYTVPLHYSSRHRQRTPDSEPGRTEPAPTKAGVALTLKTPYREGTTHIVMSPLEFMQRLAALIPRPRLHPIRFHGVLAPNARLRPEIIPTVPVNAHTPLSADPAEAPPAAAPARLSWARLLTKPPGAGFERRTPARRAKAREGFRRRVFDIDLEHCPRCGGPLKIIVAIEHPAVIAKILAHLGLPTRAPPRSPASAFHRSQLA
jgi:hypothetical protein